MSTVHATVAESWRPVVGYENLYAVSDHGRMRTFQHQRRYGRGRFRLMKLVPHSGGYWMIRLHSQKKSKGFLVHRLVYESFVGPIPEDMVINHKDGNKRNNRIDNLELATEAENQLHALWMGLKAKKLTADIVREIRKMYATGEYTYMELGRFFKVNWYTIRKIVKRWEWKWVE